MIFGTFPWKIIDFQSEIQWFFDGSKSCWDPLEGWYAEIMVFPMEIQLFLQIHVNDTSTLLGAPEALQAQNH